MVTAVLALLVSGCDSLAPEEASPAETATPAETTTPADAEALESPTQEDPRDVRIRGRFVARIPAQDFADNEALPAKRWAGRWKLVLKKGEYELSNKSFGRVTEDSRIVGGEALVFSGVPAPEGPFNCSRNGQRLTGRAAGGYRFDYDGNRLTLTTIDEPCSLRGRILERIWHALP